MGSQFSMGRLPDEMRAYAEMSLSGVMGKHGKFMRYCREVAFDNNGLFLTRVEFMETFSLDVAASHKQFGFFDLRHKGQ